MTLITCPNCESLMNAGEPCPECDHADCEDCQCPACGDGCKWHEGAEPIEDEDQPCCSHCQRLLTTRVCEGCGLEFLDWKHATADDVMASPCASSDGDLCCAGCIERVESEICRREDEDDEGELWRGYEPDDVPNDEDHP